MSEQAATIHFSLPKTAAVMSASVVTAAVVAGGVCVALGAFEQVIALGMTASACLLVSLAALIPASAQAQETQTEERRVVVMGGPGGHMEIGEVGLTREAFLARHTEMFARLDADGNGVVTRDEMHAMAEAHGDLPMRIRHPGGEGGPMVFHGEGGPGERDVVIIRRGPDGETINVEGGPGLDQDVHDSQLSLLGSIH